MAIRARLAQGVTVTWFVVLGGALAAAGVAGYALPVLVSAVAAALVVAFVALLTARPQRGVLALAAFVPLSGLLELTHAPVAVLAWKEMLVLATFAATLVAPASARAPRRARRLPSWAIAIGGLLAIGVVSAVIIGQPRGVVGLKVGFYYLLLAVAIWRCPLNGRERDHLLSVLMFMGFATACFGIAQQFMGPSQLHALGYDYNTEIRYIGGFLRSFSTFNQPFPFAAFLMIVVLISLPEVLERPRRPRNALFIAALPIVFVGILTPLVREVWIGLALGVLYLALHRYRTVLLAVPIVLVAVLFLPSSVPGAVLSQASLHERADKWTATFDHLLHNPFGKGIATSGAAAEKTQALTLGKQRVIDLGQVNQDFIFVPDNYFYQSAFQYGVIGLWLVILLFGSAFMSARAASTRLAGSDGAFARGMSAVVLAVTAVSVFSNLLESFPLDVCFWMLLAVLGTMAAQPLRSRRSDPVDA